MALFSLRNVSLTFGGPRLLDQVSLQIEHGERLCLLGRNGEGKSTLLRLIRGEIEPDEGEFIRQQGLVRFAVAPGGPSRAGWHGRRSGGRRIARSRISSQRVGPSRAGRRFSNGSGPGCAVRGPLLGNEAARAACPRPWSPSPTFCCWMSRPTTSTSNRFAGSKHFCCALAARSSS